MLMCSIIYPQKSVENWLIYLQKSVEILLIYHQKSVLYRLIYPKKVLMKCRGHYETYFYKTT